MTYEMNELLEIGDAGSTIQATKDGIMDEVSGVLGPNDGALEDE
jgi:hypothetical protein